MPGVVYHARLFVGDGQAVIEGEGDAPSWQEPLAMNAQGSSGGDGAAAAEGETRGVGEHKDAATGGCHDHRYYSHNEPFRSSADCHLRGGGKMGCMSVKGA